MNNIKKILLYKSIELLLKLKKKQKKTERH